MTLARARVGLTVTLLMAFVVSLRTLGMSNIAGGSATRGTSADGRQSTLTWFKGNTHTHTSNSDGDSTPDEVVRWYREHGYQFVVLTDHNYLTSVDALNALSGSSGQFLVIRGEEVTSRSGVKPIHVNGLDVKDLVEPPAAGSVTQMLQGSIDAIVSAGGVPNVNHPNYGWAMTADDVRQLNRLRLFEIFNGHPQVNNLGGGGTPSLEEMWDAILSSGRMMYGLAVDDAHYFKRPGDPTVPGPGRGWVYVRAERLDAAAVTGALERGDFYSSTGVELATYDVSPSAVVLSVKADTWSKYRVRFIGRGGQLLAEQTSFPARYVLRGDEGYVRAHILESNGRQAWTQPIGSGPRAPR